MSDDENDIDSNSNTSDTPLDEENNDPNGDVKVDPITALQDGIGECVLAPIRSFNPCSQCYLSH